MEPQVCLTLPLLEGTDGVKKMSKSYGNYIGLTDAPNDMFGKVMSIPDELMVKYYRLASTVPVDQIDAIEKAWQPKRFIRIAASAIWLRTLLRLTMTRKLQRKPRPLSIVSSSSMRFQKISRVCCRPYS